MRPLVWDHKVCSWSHVRSWAAQLVVVHIAPRKAHASMFLQVSKHV